MCDRLQVGSTRASCSGQADIAEKAIAYDGQNDVVTGGVTMSLLTKSDTHSTPTVFVRRAFNQLSQSAIYKEDDKTVTLSVCGGSYGGGSECLIVTQTEKSPTP